MLKHSDVFHKLYSLAIVLELNVKVCVNPFHGYNQHFIYLIHNLSSIVIVIVSEM